MPSFSNLVPTTARLSLGLLAVGALSSPSAFAGQKHVAPAITAMGKNLGNEPGSTELTLTVWLNLHNREALDARVKSLYAAGSPTYHQWLKPADFKAYAPTEREVTAVKTELASHGLTVKSVDPLGLSVRVSGTTANFEQALGTKISRYQVKDQIVRTTASVPQLGGAAAGLVAHVAGLNSLAPKPLFKRPANPLTKQEFTGVPLDANGTTQGVFFSSQCFYSPTTVSGSGVSATDGVTPVSAVASGLVYGANPNNTAAGTVAPCGYSAAQVQGFYGMAPAYKRGLTGTGQTIVIIDSYLQDQVQADANSFNRLNGLPPLNSSNFTIINPYGATLEGALFGTDQETDLDVEWAHAIAPGANIALVIAPAENDEDLQYAILYAVESQLGNTISLSYGEPEAYTGPLGLDIFNEIAELAAAEGISLNVSSGDDGDYSNDGIGADVNGWASSPFDTVIGGTSIATNPVDGSIYHIGWGNNVNQLSSGVNPTYIFDPFNQNAFYAGSGGGASSYFAKPDYQANLPGTQRLLPDVSALADPFTGAEFIYDVNGTRYIGVIGGTSLAAPIFSGMWAIANQYFGGPLGQAAPLIATLPSSVIRDVVPVAGPDNVTATLTDPKGTTRYSANALAGPLVNTTTYASALWNADAGTYFVLTFGTDSGLTVTPGWDNVTGYGTPNFAGVMSLGSPATTTP